MMPRYRKKPVEVEAVVFEWGMEDGYTTFNDHSNDPLERPHYTSKESYSEMTSKPRILKPLIKTLERWHEVSEGDYIVTGVAGERYPCKPDIFEKTYEQVQP